MCSRLTILVILYWVCGCISQEAEDEIFLPDHMKQLENLDVYSLHTLFPDTVELVKETVFESNENVFIAGYISQIAIDDSDNVYIGSTVAERGGVYVFNPDGTYRTTIGKAGRGPGEFESIGSMDLWNDQLYLFDPRLQKYAVFSIENYELKHEELIKNEGTVESDSLVHRLRGQALFVTEGGRLLFRLSMITPYRDADIPRIVYYELSPDGKLVSDKILELERFPFYFPADSRGMNYPFTMPFTLGSLVAITREGYFFTAWTEDFLINVYDKEGGHKRSFYYPVENSALSLNELDISRERQRVLDRYEMPETWPALHTMTLDDEGRLWVAVITDSETSYTWWVLDQQGQLIARFAFPGDRSSRNVMSEPLIKIKNGYFYIHEFDLHEGVDRITKNKIIFKSR